MLAIGIFGSIVQQPVIILIYFLSTSIFIALRCIYIRELIISNVSVAHVCFNVHHGGFIRPSILFTDLLNNV
jgi:hypothetical protein